MRHVVLICVAICVWGLMPAPLHAQAPAVPDAEATRKQARAVRVPNGMVRLDGRLVEEFWQSVPALTGFVQKEPEEGAPPTDPMSVHIVYDDTALYVGARMASRSRIESPMGRRDDAGLAEQLLVSLDTYLDRRTASTFGITSAGVRLDRYYGSDDEEAADDGFDPVWQGRVTVDERGWNAELWIPFSQLRFNDRDPQVWGINIQRLVPAQNEEVYWVLVPRTEQRWASLFGELHGLAGIRPRRRLEVLPYAAASSERRADRDPANPFRGSGDFDGRIGADAKVGIGSNLTLEATVNPDFGQVEADPAEVNLTAFETFFDERRPFFLEGSQLLSGFVNNYFYSRRIGAPPAGRASGDFIERPSTTTILGAGKLTGRLQSGTSIGLLAAVTGEESARTFRAPDLFGRVRVAPRTAFGVGRVEQEFGPPGSTAGVMATIVHRDVNADDPLSALVTRNAVSVSGDAVLRLNDGEYEARMFAGSSYVDGEAAAIDRLQRSSARYFHRPDAAHLDYDPTRTSMTGVKAGGAIERRTGEHWNWLADAQVETAGFETNDLGRTSSVDQIEAAWRLDYRETVPGRWWRNYALAVGQENTWSLARDRESRLFGGSGSITWPNFWETEGEIAYTLRGYDPRLTRGGPMMQTPLGWSARVEAENNNASRVRGELSFGYGRDEDGGLTMEAGSRFELEPGAQWQLSIEPQYSRTVGTQQYVTTLDRHAGDDPLASPVVTFGERYIFARIDRSTYTTQVRFTYTFKPDLTLDFYGEPFAASGRYSGLGELAAARSRALRIYGTDGTSAMRLADGSLQVADGGSTFVLENEDFNVRSFRSNLVLRWEWRPGSTLFLVWQQDRSDEEALGLRASLGDMFGSLNTRGNHFFALKASVWLSPN